MAKPRKESNEEQQFESWLDEARTAGLVDAYLKQPESFHLIDKERVNGRHLHAKHVYTADFRVYLTPLGMEILRGMFQKSDVLGLPNNEVYVDTKGGHMSRGSGQEFGINQKLVYERHGVWPAKVVPFVSGKKVTKKRANAVPAWGWFVDTWCPAACRWAKPTKKPAIGITEAGCAACRTVDGFLESTKGGTT